MKVVFFPLGDQNLPSSRYRVYFMAGELEKQGIETKIYPPLTALLLRIGYAGALAELLNRVKELAQLKSTDIIYAQKLVYLNLRSALLIIFKQIFGKKLVFDLDDAMFAKKFQSRSNITNYMLKISDAVIVSSRYLEEHARKYNKSVFYVPTPVTMPRIGTERNNQKFTIGWVGIGSVHEKNLEILVEPLKILGKKYKLKLVLLGAAGSEKIKSMFSGIEGVELEIPENVNWLDQSQVEREISKFDVGVMPLFEDEITLGKTAFKCKQYMSLGVPTISSPVGEVNYLIEEGVNGFLASTTSEWAEKIELLINSKELRDKISANGRKTAKSYTYEAVGKRLAEILRTLSER